MEVIASASEVGLQDTERKRQRSNRQRNRDKPRACEHVPKRMADVARAEALRKQRETMLAFRLKQMEEFYAPMFALLGQSLGLHDKMMRKLLRGPGVYNIARRTDSLQPIKRVRNWVEQPIFVSPPDESPRYIEQAVSSSEVVGLILETPSEPQAPSGPLAY